MKDVDAYKELLIKKCPKNFVVNVTESQGYTQCNVTGDKRIILLDFKTYARARVRETIKVPESMYGRIHFYPHWSLWTKQTPC